MENAASAIKMAGELLIGLLLISLFVFVFSQMENVEDAKDKDVAFQQTIEFNKKFEAFDKRSMYGTDLISVLALAYATNQTANASTTFKSSSVQYDGYYDPDIATSINIHFTVNTDIQKKTTITEYYTDPNTNMQTKTKSPNIEYLGDKSKNPNIKVNPSTDTLFKASKTDGYSLKANPDNSDEMKVVENIKNIVIDGNTTKKSYETHKKYYNAIGAHTTFTIETVTDTEAGFNDFKKCIFECYDIKYSSIGRIKEMYFREKEIN